MQIFKRTLSIALLTIILIIVLENNLCITTGAIIYRVGSPISIGIFTRDINDDYIVLLRKNFEDIQKNSQEKVIFTFYNANFDQSTQNVDIQNALYKNIDFILLDMVNLLEIQGIINEIKKCNVPILVFNRVPFSMDVIKSYEKAFYVGTDSVQSATLQGKIIVDAWNNHKKLIDKNEDYVL